MKAIFAVLLIFSVARALPFPLPGLGEGRSLGLPVVKRSIQQSQNEGNSLVTFESEIFSLMGKYNVPIEAVGRDSKLASENEEDGVGERMKRALKLKKRAQAALQMVNGKTDIVYYGTVFIGTPPQPFQLILDTGSADLVVASSPCNSTSGCLPTTPLYDPSNSTSALTSSSTFRISYGSGLAEGSLVSDWVGFGLPQDGYGSSDIILAACHTLEGIVTQGEALSGIIGLGWRGPNDPYKTLIQALWEKDLLESPEFGFAFSRWLTHETPAGGVDKLEVGGIMTLGGVNTSLTDHVTYYNLYPGPDGGDHSWSIPLDGVFLNGVDIGVKEPVVNIDTGTSLIGVPQKDAATIWGNVPGARQLTETIYVYPCNLDIVVSLKFGEDVYGIDPRDLNAGFMDKNETTPMCIGSIFAFPSGSGLKDMWIIGDSFLKNVYASFRFEPPSIGFGKLKSDAAASLRVGELGTPEEEGRLAHYSDLVLSESTTTSQQPTQTPIITTNNGSSSALTINALLITLSILVLAY